MVTTPAPGRQPFFMFMVTAVVLSVTLGVSTGGWAIWQMAFAAGTVLASHLQLHAHVQLFGFAFLFILGVTFQSLPAVLAIPPAPRLVLHAALLGVGGGALLRAIGQPLAPWAAGRFVSLLSGVLELAGVFAFAAWILPVLVSRGASRDPFSLHVLLGTVWAVLAAALSAAQALFLAGHAESVIPGDLVEPFYAVALYGLFLSFAFAFSSRMVPGILGLPGPTARSARPLAALQAAGVVLLAAAWLPALPSPAARSLALLGTLLVAGAVLLFLTASRLLAPFAGGPGALSLRAPFAFLGLFAALSIAAAVAEIGGGSVHKFVWDGARHVYTIGFLTLLIVAMSLHVVPAFTGRTLTRRREARAAYALVVVAAAVRAVQIPVALGWGGLPLYRLVGTTGIFATVGLLLFTHVLAGTFGREAP